jgi:hypothetical protein
VRDEASLARDEASLVRNKASLVEAPSQFGDDPSKARIAALAVNQPLSRDALIRS